MPKISAIGGSAFGTTSRFEFSIKSGVKHTTLTKIEGDLVKKPGVQMIAKIAKALGVSMEELIK